MLRLSKEVVISESPEVELLLLLAGGESGFSELSELFKLRAAVLETAGEVGEPFGEGLAEFWAGEVIGECAGVDGGGGDG